MFNACNIVHDVCSLLTNGRRCQRRSGTKHDPHTPTRNGTPVSDDTRPGLPDFPQPDHQMLGDKIYGLIKDALLSHAIAPGTRLNLADLSRSLHVSNTPVRQALTRLAGEGLVVQEAYRGFRASALLEDRGITELYEFRELVEPAGAARAAQVRTDDDVHLLVGLCDAAQVDRLLDAGGPRNELGQRDAELHATIARASGNSVLAECVQDLVMRAGHYTLYHKREAAVQAWEEHREIIQAIADRDTRAARAAMRTHLEMGRKRIRDSVPHR